MNLIIDIGNTRLKYALFEEKEIVVADSCLLSDAPDLLKKVVSDHAVNAVIIASVVSDFENVLKKISASVKNILIFKPDTKIPLKNLYRSAGTLGSDRIAAAVGAVCKITGKDILVIDAGTCIKYNFVNKKNEYLGGGISPGIEMRFKALHHFTDKLPLIAFDEHFDALVGDTTQDSILSGVITGTVAEVEMMINYYELKYPGIKVVITGGNGSFLANRIKKYIFAEPYLILIGLNEILRSNSLK